MAKRGMHHSSKSTTGEDSYSGQLDGADLGGNFRGEPTERLKKVRASCAYIQVCVASTFEVGCVSVVWMCVRAYRSYPSFHRCLTSSHTFISPSIPGRGWSAQTGSAIRGARA